MIFYYNSSDSSDSSESSVSSDSCESSDSSDSCYENKLLWPKFCDKKDKNFVIIFFLINKKISCKKLFVRQKIVMRKSVWWNFFVLKLILGWNFFCDEIFKEIFFCDKY